MGQEELDTARKARALGSLIKTAQDSFTALERCTKPVIAAVHAHCIGAGISMVACADVRYASADALFSIRVMNAHGFGKEARVRIPIGRMDFSSQRRIQFYTYYLNRKWTLAWPLMWVFFNGSIWSPAMTVGHASWHSRQGMRQLTRHYDSVRFF